MIFPDTILHNSGTRLKLDDTLLLLGFREPTSRADVQNLLDQTSVRLEEITSVQEQNGHQVKREVNHTNRLYWVHSRDGKSISNNDLGSLRQTLSNQLEWVGPVLRFPAAKANPKGHPVCALPHVLIVKPKKASVTEDLNHALAMFGLGYREGISQYLNGLRLYYLAPSSNAPMMHAVRHVLPPTAAHDLQIRLRDKKYEDLIASIHLDYMPMFVPAAGPNDPYYSQQWNLQQIKAEQGWTQAGWKTSVNPFPAGTGVRVAIIDGAGFQLDHEDLAAGINPELAATFYTPGTTPDRLIGPPDGGREQGQSHGTRCAGILAARCNNKDAAGNSYIGITGLAGACEIVPLKIEGNITSTFAAAIGYATDSNCQIISYSDSAPELQDPTVLHQIETAFTQNVTICAAAGNDDQGQVGYPAAYQNYVIACGATDHSVNEDRCTGNVWNSGGSNYGDALSVVAPGVDIYTCDNGNRYVPDFWGTSAATPHVAALAALIISEYPALKTQASVVRAIIEGSADEVGRVTVVDTTRYPNAAVGDNLPYGPSAIHPTKNWNWETGYGRINVFKAMQLADQLLTPDRPGTHPAFDDLKDIQREIIERLRTTVRYPIIPPTRPKTPPGPKKEIVSK